MDVRHPESRKHGISLLTGYDLGGTVTERRYQKMSWIPSNSNQKLQHQAIFWWWFSTAVWVTHEGQWVWRQWHEFSFGNSKDEVPGKMVQVRWNKHMPPLFPTECNYKIYRNLHKIGVLSKEKSAGKLENTRTQSTVLANMWWVYHSLKNTVIFYLNLTWNSWNWALW